MIAAAAAADRQLLADYVSGRGTNHRFGEMSWSITQLICEEETGVYRTHRYIKIYK